jgi:uncharacterized protein YrrD
MNNVENIDAIVGRAVVSLESANELGQVADLLIDPLSGQLAGLAVDGKDESSALAGIVDVHGIGPHAIILEHDASLVLADTSPLATLPKAKSNLKGVKVLTEHGQLLGNISNLYICVDGKPTFIYEVRSSLFDTLFGRAFYLAASLGCAFSDDRSSLVVTGDPENMDHKLEAAAERVLGSSTSPLRASAFRVEVRTHAE